MKKIEDYTADELSAKIEKIKVEREKTANALKKYEEELERRKQEVQLGLGVPIDLLHFNLEEIVTKIRIEHFASEKSALLFNEKYDVWVEQTKNNFKGEQIDIEVLLPLLRKGYVAMARNKRWYWYSSKPNIDLFLEMWKGGPETYHIGGFNLKPADDWKTSLMECGL